MSILEISRDKRNLLKDLVKDLKDYLHKSPNHMSLEDIMLSYRESQPMIDGAPMIDGYSYNPDKKSIKLYLSIVNADSHIFCQTLEVE